MEPIKQKISCFRVFLEKGHPSLVFRPGKKYHVFGKKIPPFQVVQERSCPGAILFEKTIFSEDLKKISYFRVFFLIFFFFSFFIFRLGVRSYFLEKEISSFPIIQERSNSSTIFSERPSFQDVWKKKIWLFMQCDKSKESKDVWMFSNDMEKLTLSDDVVLYRHNTENQ